MADERTVRLDLTFAEVETLAWAVWFAAPAAQTMHQPPLDSLHAKLLLKRRQLRAARSDEELDRQAVGLGGGEAT